MPKLDRINSLVPDPYAIPFSKIPTPALGAVALPTPFVAPPKPRETPVISSLHPARFLTLQSSGTTFAETFHVILAGDRSIDFTMVDVSEYPAVKMPRQPHQYLQKLLSIWDDDSHTWDAASCPVVGGSRIAAKHWKVVFSKGGHWKASSNRTQWHKWKVTESIFSIIHAEIMLLLRCWLKNCRRSVTALRSSSNSIKTHVVCL